MGYCGNYFRVLELFSALYDTLAPNAEWECERHCFILSSCFVRASAHRLRLSTDWSIFPWCMKAISWIVSHVKPKHLTIHSISFIIPYDPTNHQMQPALLTAPISAPQTNKTYDIPRTLCTNAHCENVSAQLVFSAQAKILQLQHSVRLRNSVSRSNRI
jgi:hypothetical protein